MSNTNQPLPDEREDDVSHINVYMAGKSRLGRLLSNLADIQVTHPKYGKFRTLEGLWFYLKSGMVHEDLRAMSGYDAKKFGGGVKKVWFPDFMAEIKIGIRCKIEQHAELKELVEESTLPFEHYYVYPSGVVVPRGSKLLCQMLEDIRSEM